MKKSYLLFLLCLLLSQSTFALDANVSHAVFENTKGEAFVEVYLHLVGTTLNYQQLDQQFNAEADVLILFKKGEDIVKFEKYRLSSPLATDKEGWKPDLVDLRRVVLPPGDYTLEVSVQDTNLESNKSQFQESINIPEPDSKVKCSDIMLLANLATSEDPKETFHRNGLFMEPLVHNFMHYSRTNIIFYTEIYQAQKHLEDGILVRYYIEDTKAPGKALSEYIGNKKQKLDPINIVITTLDITNLPSGNYNLVVEVRDKFNDLQAIQKKYFQRSNPYLQVDIDAWEEQKWEETFVAQIKDEDLLYSLESIFPRVQPQQEKAYNTVLKSKDTDIQRRYLFTYWASIDANQPKEAFLDYMTLIEALNERYKSAMMMGSKSDRAYIYLKYGPPNNAIEFTNQPSTPPYEIWEYDRLSATQGFCKFIFYNPTLAGNQYELLHSTAVGEVYNPQWKRELYKHARQTGNAVDGTGVEDNFGNNASDIFDQ